MTGYNWGDGELICTVKHPELGYGVAVHKWTLRDDEWVVVPKE